MTEHQTSRPQSTHVASKDHGMSAVGPCIDEARRLSSVACGCGSTRTCRVHVNAAQKRYPIERDVTIGLTRNLLVLVTVPTEDRVVSVARVDNHEYATDALIDQRESML